jgi:hypothetical protein
MSFCKYSLMCFFVDFFFFCYFCTPSIVCQQLTYASGRTGLSMHASGNCTSNFSAPLHHRYVMNRFLKFLCYVNGDSPIHNLLKFVLIFFLVLLLLDIMFQGRNFLILCMLYGLCYVSGDSPIHCLLKFFEFFFQFCCCCWISCFGVGSSSS